MNAEERQALREKHVYTKLSPPLYEGCAECWVYTFEDEPRIVPAAYPCDVIKVLDAWEAVGETVPFGEQSLHSPEPVGETDPKLPECDHLTEIDEGWGYFEFTYCPKCGEKL